MSTSTVMLFHGTDTNVAAAIATQGFVPLDVDAVVSRVAAAFNLRPDELAPPDSFVATRRTDSAVYVTPNFMHAAGYALRSRELERDLYESTYWLTTNRPYAARDPDMQAWVRGHLPQQPTVVVLEVPAAELAPEVVADILEHNECHDHDWPLGYHLDIKLGSGLASRSRIGATPVDFCTCTPDSRPLSIYECEHESCLECRQFRTNLNNEPGDCIGMWRNIKGRTLNPAALAARLADLARRGARPRLNLDGRRQETAELLGQEPT